MSLMLKPYEGNPILEPRGDDWESVAVFNPAAIYRKDKIQVLYRAVGEYYPYVSRLGYAVFDKDLNLMERFRDPCFVPDLKVWERSIEDPRLTELAGELYLTLCDHAYAESPGRCSPASGHPDAH